MDKIFEITIDENSVGDRIDKFLSLSIPSLSSHIYFRFKKAIIASVCFF